MANAHVIMVDAAKLYLAEMKEKLFVVENVYRHLDVLVELSVDLLRWPEIVNLLRSPEIANLVRWPERGGFVPGAPLNGSSERARKIALLTLVLQNTDDLLSLLNILKQMHEASNPVIAETGNQILMRASRMRNLMRTLRTYLMKSWEVSNELSDHLRSEAVLLEEAYVRGDHLAGALQEARLMANAMFRSRKLGRSEKAPEE